MWWGDEANVEEVTLKEEEDKTNMIVGQEYMGMGIKGKGKGVKVKGSSYSLTAVWWGDEAKSGVGREVTLTEEEEEDKEDMKEDREKDQGAGWLVTNNT